MGACIRLIGACNLLAVVTMRATLAAVIALSAQPSELVEIAVRLTGL